MVKYVKSLIIVGAIGLASCAFADSSPVAVVNLNTVFQQVPQGQAAFDQLQKQLAPQSTKLQNQQTALNQQVQAYQNNKVNLTPVQQSSQEAQLLLQQEKLQTSLN